MALIRYKNPCDYSFLVWMEEFPNSTHPLDEERFRTFAKTVAVYRNRKWLDFTYFKTRITNHSPSFEQESIQTYWERLNDFVLFHKTQQIPITEHGGRDGDYNCYQIGVDKNLIYSIPISQNEYLHKGVNKKEARRRLI